jgi:hypothetical protein
MEIEMKIVKEIEVEIEPNDGYKLIAEDHLGSLDKIRFLFASLRTVTLQDFEDVQTAFPGAYEHNKEEVEAAKKFLTEFKQITAKNLQEKSRILCQTLDKSKER